VPSWRNAAMAESTASQRSARSNAQADCVRLSQPDAEGENQSPDTFLCCFCNIFLKTTSDGCDRCCCHLAVGLRWLLLTS
jgi:hypothetical protein